MRPFLQTIACFLGILFLVAPGLAWLFGWAEIMAGNNGELQRIGANDKAGDYQLLTFGPWRDGSGDCSPSTYATWPEDATITRYRIGHAYHALTRMNYYEAEYSLPDGATQINHAQGPQPLFTYRWYNLIAISVLSPLLALGLFWAGTISNRAVRKTPTAVVLADGVQH